MDVKNLGSAATNQGILPAPADAAAVKPEAPQQSSIDNDSRDAVSPVPSCHSTRPEDVEKRYRPRTFPYFRCLPFPVEQESVRDDALDEIVKNLYIAVKAEDFSPGALHHTRELQGWMSLKFEMTRERRAELARLYYHLALAPGVDNNVADRFARILIALTRKKHYLKPVDDLTLDWRPLWREIKGLALPADAASHQGHRRRSQKHIMKLSLQAQTYFDPRQRRPMLDEFLPYFTTSDMSNAYVVISLLALLLPTGPAPPTDRQSQPADLLPTFFHLWSIMSRSRACDTMFIDLLSRLARDHLLSRHTRFTEHGIFTTDQSDLIFTAILRMTDIPVGQANSSYTSIDYHNGLAVLLDKDKKKFPPAYMIARWIVYGLSPYCLHAKTSILSRLEGLLQAIETFFHPSNHGFWTTFLAQLTFYLSDLFVSRWNQEQSGELDTPNGRRITPDLRSRFVLALRDVTFVGLFAKSSKVANYYFSTLQNLAYMDPRLVLPGALQRFYPSLQGLVEVHRTTSSLCGLQMIAATMCCERGFRCHVTALLALTLPGIDANDLGKTQHTLNLIQTIAYCIPFAAMFSGHGTGDYDNDNSILDGTLATQWVQAEMERMERDGQNVSIDYDAQLSDEEEAKILRSSTAAFAEFVPALLGKIFTVLENLPDPSHLRTGSPEESVVNALPAALSPLFATLSPDLFDVVLQKVVNFVSTHVVHQARDAMAWICNGLCKADPAKALKAFIPMLIIGIHHEIEENGAASDRSAGTEILPRDRALVWHISILSMCVVHVGHDVLRYQTDLLSIAHFMQEQCRGVPAIHISNFIHHLLVNLTHTYPVDHTLYEPEVLNRGLDIDDWGWLTPPSQLTIRWHRPSPVEIDFAMNLFDVHVSTATRRLTDLMSDTPPVPRTGKAKEWSDEMSRNLNALRLYVSGISALFDPLRASGDRSPRDNMPLSSHEAQDNEDPLAEVADDDEMERLFVYPAGFLLDRSDPRYARVHQLRNDIGELLSRTHSFLQHHHEDDVACFTALYAAYRTWITDVGIERSAHPLERQMRLYKSDIPPFDIGGLRKPYPRPLLIKRADAYHLQRIKYNAAFRRRSPLDERLLLDLAESSTSAYSDVRRTAQSASDSSLKVLLGGRPVVIPVLLEKLRQSLLANDHDRIKGAIYTLLFTSLIKTLMRDWRFAPRLMRLYIDSAAVDKHSVQALGSTALYALLEFGKPFERMIIIDDAIVDLIKPPSSSPHYDECARRIHERHAFIRERRRRVELKKAELGAELTQRAKESHWKVATRCAIFAANLCLRFDSVAPLEFIDLVAHGTNDPHPTLRANYQATFVHLLTTIEMRACYGHDYRNFLTEKETDVNRIEVDVPHKGGDAQWTQRFLAAFADDESGGGGGGADNGSAAPEYYVDSHFPGWLVWAKSFRAFRADPKPFVDYDEVEMVARQRIGHILTKDWFRQNFEYLKQEPRDAGADRIRMQNVMLLMHVFDLMQYGQTAATFADLQDLIADVYGDGSDKHQHRATAEILAALLSGGTDDLRDIRNRTWAFAAPLMLKIIADDLTPDNLSYWLTCLHLVLDGKDPRRSKEIVHALSAFRLDMSSNAAFKESAKVHLLELVINDAGWHYRHDQPILDDFLAHIDHPYKSVRESMARVLAAIYRARYHESFPSVDHLLEANCRESDVGISPYTPSPDLTDTMRDVFARLEQWRRERTPGQQKPSSYTSASKTVLNWLDSTLSSQECTQLVHLFPDTFIDQLLHMMDVKEDPELMRLAYHVYRHLPNIPFRLGEDDAFIRALIRVGRTAASWHQRLRALVNLQVVYFRRLFLTSDAQRHRIFKAVGDMLADTQLEVRECASATLAGMIRCSPSQVREPIIRELRDRFKDELRQNPMPPQRRHIAGTETPVDVQERIRRRHAAVLGLGALIEAFPYATPPPEWMPGVLAHLATRTASDTGVVGKTTKDILSEFKKTRQDSWSVDQKYFTLEQLEDLEGVLWKSYFA